MAFVGSKLKVQRAEKHIYDLYEFLFFASSKPDFYSVAIEKVDAKWGLNDLVVTVHQPQQEFLNDCALIIGDVLHNLRSSLDILYFEVVKLCHGKPGKWTRFPIFETRQKLEAALKSALKQKQISSIVADFILNKVEPCRDRNFRIWSVHELNIGDKHQLLIPTFQVIGFEGICIEDEKNAVIEHPTILGETSCRVLLDSDIYGWNPKLKDKGRASTGIGFAPGTVYEGEPVIPTLRMISVEIAGMIQAFETLLEV